MDLLAAMFAENGQFGKTRENATKAYELALKSGKRQLAKETYGRLNYTKRICLFGRCLTNMDAFFCTLVSDNCKFNIRLKKIEKEIMNSKYQVSLFIILIIVTTTACTQDKGGRWQFEDNGFDTADWDNLEDPGTLQGTATYSELNPVEGNSFLWLDTLSVNNFFKIVDSDDLDFTDEDIGISMWIYPIVIKGVHFLVNKGDQISVPKTTNYSLRITEGGRLEFLVRNSSHAQKVKSSFSIPANQWTFVAAFYDYDAAKVYIWNSNILTPIDTLDFNQSFFANDDPLSIGSWYRSDPENPAHRDFNGRIDDVRISGLLENIIPVISGMEHLERLSDKFQIK